MSIGAALAISGAVFILMALVFSVALDQHNNPKSADRYRALGWFCFAMGCALLIAAPWSGVRVM